MLQVVPGFETKQHLCEFMKCGCDIIRFDKPRDLGKPYSFCILIHDIHSYLFFNDTKNTYPVSYCPYCGVDIDNDR